MEQVANIAAIVVVYLVVIVTQASTMKVVHPGRHVCMDTRQVQSPTRQIQSYCQPSYQKQLRMCDVNGAYRLCTSFRVVYKTAYRQVFISALASHHVYLCCPGWTQENPRDRGCMKPVCSLQCQNGGECKDQKCLCQQGWTGVHCESDIDECSGESVCEQTCTNTPGSFQCGCQEGFQLDDDTKTCKYCLKCQPEYKGLVNDYNQVLHRLTDMEAKLKVKPTSNFAVQTEEAANMPKQQMQKDVDIQLVDNLRTDLRQDIEQMHGALKARLLDDIFSYMKQTVKPEIEEVVLNYVQTKLNASITADLRDYVDKQIEGNMTLCREVLQRDLSQFTTELKSYKGTLRTYNRDMVAYRQEVEHYKNELKDEMGKYRNQVGALRKEVQDQFAERSEQIEYSRLVSLSEQIGMLEAKIATCMCGR